VAEFTERALRDALGRFVTGVTVVTTMTRRGPLGMTVNSFSSVSLDPPLVLWSPARRSSRFAAFEASNHFAIHVLAEDQVPLAEHFARKGGFEGIAFTAGIGDAPLIEGATARLECLHAVHYDGGDHLIVVGEVLRVVEAERPPLLYFRGAYRALGA
jgi:flavin reductase (DIM6/NTAB) family NADH-FMN oxidoreductase RutF